MIKAIIFDLDGTLLDTLEDIRIALNKAFCAYHYNAHFTYEETKKFVGNGAKNLVINAGKALNAKEEDIQDILNNYMNRYKDDCVTYTKPFLHVEETLKELRKNNIILGVLSNKPDRDVKTCINKYFPNVFDVCYGSRDGVKLKPNPEALESILQEIKVSKEETLYVGDMYVDEMLSKNANVKFVGCLFGYNFKKFENYYALINDFQELLELVK